MTVTPSLEQQSVLDRGLATTRVRAGAGTGKTTTVAMVLANLVERHGLEPERLLGITFTNKAAAELADRTREMLGPHVDEGRQAEIHTYHGFAAQVLAEFGSLAGLHDRVRIVTPTFARQMLSDIFHSRTFEHLDPTYPGTVDRIRLLSDRLSDHLLSPDDLPGPESEDDIVGAKRTEMAAVLKEFAAEKLRLGVLDYGDLVTLSTRIMGKHPELASQVRDRYQAVVLDEYQDTNPAQRMLLTSIFTSGFPVIAVGDEDQTIYEWRGASPENFARFPRDFGGDEEPMTLTLNRRSAQSVLDVANLVRRKASPSAEPLVSAEPNRSGEVITYWANDAIAEADWIAERLRHFHDDGKQWRDMAVLLRKNKDFAVIVEAMRHADIPIEVANLGGLLSVPEVADLRAWLEILDRPSNSAAATQVLLGGRYRLGLADLARLTSWISQHEEVDARDDEDVPGVSVLEAIESIDQVEGMSSAGAEACRHFFAVYREVLIESQGETLVETCRLVLDRTRAWADVEALPRARRLTARLNLYRMLDLAEDWSPLSGRPSLSAFLEYLEAMEQEPAEELDAAHLSGEDAVTLVTIHRAKGLEWDIVAVPTVYDGNFPGGSNQFPDPVRFAEYLPPELRIDSMLDDMPASDDERRAFFRRQNRRQEWRVAYVAVTRARTTLLMSGAYWYGRPEPNKKPRDPSELFKLVASHPMTVSSAANGPGERPERLYRDQPALSPDPHFRGGWAAAVREMVEDRFDLADVVDAALEGEIDERISGMKETLFELKDIALDHPPSAEQVVSVTGLVTYAGCPKRFYWTAVDPLPRRRNPAATAGTELHRRIELFHRGQVPFDEISEDLYDVPGESAGGGAWAAFEGSRFASAKPILVEAPFLLELANGYRVRGRIDAVYSTDRDWEIVDFKSGRPTGDEAPMVQLEAYAVAARDADMGVDPPSRMTVTFAYLGGGLEEQSHQADERWIDEAADHLVDITDAIAAEKFGPRAGPGCAGCDFLQFCEAGQGWIAGR